MSYLSRSTHAEYGDVIAPRDSLLLPSETSVEIHSKNFLNVDRQRRPEAMKEPYHRWRKMIPKQNIRIHPYSDNGASQSFAELGSSGGELGAPQGYMLHSVSMDTLRPADAHREVEIPMYSPGPEPVQHQTWALLHSAQTSMLRRPHKAVPWKGVRGDYEKRSTPHPYYYPHLATSEYGRASEIDTDGSSSCLPQHRMNPNVFTNIEAGKGDVQSSVTDPSGPSVVSFISGGTKRYRCRCGFESASKGRMDRHRDSLQHSERKHRCPCGRLFTRDDSLKRHRKRCNN